MLPWRGNSHRPHILRRQWLVGLLALALGCEAVILGHSAIMGGPNVFLAAVVRSDVIAYTEEARVDEGGQELRESDVLNRAAQAKADDMAARGYFSHQGPGGEAPWTWFEKAGYRYVYAGENLAVKFTDSKRVVDAWMASPKHRANIVKSQYQEIGVGIAQGSYKGSAATFVVQFFASPAAQAAAPAAAENASENVAVSAASELLPTPIAVAEAPAAQAEPVQASSVAGAEVEPAGAVQPAPLPASRSSGLQSAVRSAGEALVDSREAATWGLAIVAGLLMAVLALTFFIRIQVQPTDLLVPGIAVALVAMLFLGANAALLPGGASQSASVAGSGQGDVGSGASVERVQVAFPEHPSQ